MLDRDAYGDRDAYRLPELCLTVMLMVTVMLIGSRNCAWPWCLWWPLMLMVPRARVGIQLVSWMILIRPLGPNPETLSLQFPISIQGLRPWHLHVWTPGDPRCYPCGLAARAAPHASADLCVSIDFKAGNWHVCNRISLLCSCFLMVVTVTEGCGVPNTQSPPILVLCQTNSLSSCTPPLQTSLSTSSALMCSTL